MAKKNPKINVAVKRSAWLDLLEKTEEFELEAVREIRRLVRENDEARAAHDPNRPPTKQSSFGLCEVCESPLMSPGGYGGTGMCGPCTTGEAATLLE